MKLRLGIKSDPIEYRYSFDWLFEFMEQRGIDRLQLGSFFELYHLEDGYFHRLRESADERGVRIKSCFTAHRELGGFFTGDPALESVARSCYERYIEIAAILGADYIGSNPGAVYRDTMERKPEGIRRYVRHMGELARYAADRGIAGLTLEPMSSLAEPPSTPEEIEQLMRGISAATRNEHDRAARCYVCGDTSHGLIGGDGSVVYHHERVFESGIPWMAEFHFKNTDSRYHSTFGFGSDDRPRGVVDLEKFRLLIERNESRFPVEEVVGYLEIGGPKLGRDYSDPLLGGMLDESIRAIRDVFGSI